MPSKPPHSHREFFINDAEMHSSFAPLSEIAFEMEMDGTEPILPALPQRWLDEEPNVHSSSILSSGKTIPTSTPSRVHPGSTTRRTTASGDSTPASPPLAQSFRSAGRTPMVRVILPSMMRAAQPRNELERWARSILRSPG